jgi:hypothetical protein
LTVRASLNAAQFQFFAFQFLGFLTEIIPTRHPFAKFFPVLKKLKEKLNRKNIPSTFSDPWNVFPIQFFIQFFASSDRLLVESTF